MGLERAGEFATSLVAEAEKAFNSVSEPVSKIASKVQKISRDNPVPTGAGVTSLIFGGLAVKTRSPALGCIAAVVALAGVGYEVYTKRNSPAAANSPAVANPPAAANEHELTRMEKVQEKLKAVANAVWETVKYVGYFLATPVRIIGKLACTKAVQAVSAVRVLSSWVWNDLPSRNGNNDFLCTRKV